ncbi:MAG: Sir2 family NAD-dependent protein deacetylase [Candidatus Binatia bacterium]|nr:Sir2 family NAD-dependent protein deacetylase [Candidatus Binatia bacterium]
MADGATDLLARAVELVRGSKKVVALTGAGLSTESGIPDFRSPGGVWEKYKPVEYADFQRSEEARRAHWQYKAATIPPMLAARPNPAHDALRRLEEAGRLLAVITQNIDGLHQAAGSRQVLELHGTNRHTVCLQCGAEESIQTVLARLEAGEDVPKCKACGGALKPATVSFGQMLPPDVLRQAMEHTRRADCLLALGTSLQVQPAASLVDVAKEHGAKVVVVTRSSTPYDSIADAKLDHPLGTCLPAIVAGVLDGAP